MIFHKVNNMAMFLESSVEQKVEIKPVSIIAIMEELTDITIELSESIECLFQEEYSILTEEADEKAKEEKKTGFKEKVASTVRSIVDKIRVAVVKIKQFLLYYITKALGSKKFARAPKELTIFLGKHSVAFGMKDFKDPSKFDDIKKAIETEKASFEKAKSDSEMFTTKADDFKKNLNALKVFFDSVESGIKADPDLPPEGAKLLQAYVSFSLAIVHAVASKTKGLEKDSEEK